MNYDLSKTCAVIGIIIAIIIVIVLLCLHKKVFQKEDFTTDEAIQNVASLYNQGNLTVTNITSTGTGTFNNLSATGTSTLPNISSSTLNTNTCNTKNATVTGTLTSGTVNINNNAKVTGLLSTGSLSVGTTADITGNTKVKGTFTPLSGEQIVLITSTTAWDRTKWVAAAAPYFKKSMPDGTMIKFLIAINSYGAYGASGANYSYIYGNGIKHGNQFLWMNEYQMTNRGDVMRNSSNDTQWAGNITNA